MKKILLALLLIGCSNSSYDGISKKTISSEKNLIQNQHSVCQNDMTLVVGNFCPKAKFDCLDWMEDPVKHPYARCMLYGISECISDRKHMRFCIDKLEFSDDSGMPVPDVSWTQAKQMCEQKDKRLCKEEEWLFACEGEEMLPYPYGYGRNPVLCNFEIYSDLVGSNNKLKDHRKPADSNPLCISPFGVRNMVGNIDEWVVLDKPHFSNKNRGRKMMSGLKGGWWGPLRNRCRPTTVDHDEVFHEFQTGFRCCSDK